MRLDNTAFSYAQECLWKYFERYEYDCDVCALSSAANPSSEGGLHSLSALGIEKDVPKPDRDFGTRFHQLVENLRRGFIGLSPKTYPEWPDESIEAEAQATFAAYCGHYVVEPLQFISAERTEVIPIPGTKHALVVKIDGVIRHGDGSIGPLDTKTEQPRGLSNTPQAWAAKTQATLYLWALSQLYPSERVTRMVVDVVTRGGPKTAPIFRRMDDIARTSERITETLHAFTEVCDDIERARESGWWRPNFNACQRGWQRCDYYELHIFGKTQENLRLYKPGGAYLEL